MFATRSLKAFVAASAMAIALFAAAVPAQAKPGNGNAHKPHGSSNSDLCAEIWGPGVPCIIIPLT